MKRHILALLLAMPFLSCGSSPTVEIPVTLAPGMDPNVMKQVAAGLDTVYKGIYFEFREMKCPPATWSDTADSTGATVALYFPPTTQPGANPLETSFTIDTSSLKTKTYYQVRMSILKIGSGGAAYDGYGDCPLYLGSPEVNRIRICLGNLGTVPSTCVGTTPWGSCPAPTATCS